MLLLIIVQHVSKDVFRVLQPLCHFGVVTVQGLVQRHRGSFTLLVNVGHKSVLRIQKDLGVVLEVHLDNLVAKSEHDGMLGSHPLLHVHGSWWILELVGFVHFVSLNEGFFLSWIIVLLKI